MVKGVNRQIVEVKDTGSDYFERIIFIVNPEYSYASKSIIKDRAGQIAIDALGEPEQREKKHKSRLILPLVKLLSAAGIGAAAMAIISNL